MLYKNAHKISAHTVPRRSEDPKIRRCKTRAMSTQRYSTVFFRISVQVSLQRFSPECSPMGLLLIVMMMIMIQNGRRIQMCCSMSSLLFRGDVGPRKAAPMDVWVLIHPGFKQVLQFLNIYQFPKSNIEFTVSVIMIFLCFETSYRSFQS